MGLESGVSDSAFGNLLVFASCLVCFRLLLIILRALIAAFHHDSYSLRLKHLILCHLRKSFVINLAPITSYSKTIKLVHLQHLLIIYHKQFLPLN